MFKDVFLGSSRGGSATTNPTSIYEDMGSILGPTQWVKVPVLQVTDMAQILCCCGCGVGQQLQL